jgi:hypothetical protein
MLPADSRGSGTCAKDGRRMVETRQRLHAKHDQPDPKGRAQTQSSSRPPITFLFTGTKLDAAA